MVTKMSGVTHKLLHVTIMYAHATSKALLRNKFKKIISNLIGHDQILSSEHSYKRLPDS